jgi:CDP-4-dehydro-6-deoxyglucose reductase, E3
MTRVATPESRRRLCTWSRLPKRGVTPTARNGSTRDCEDVSAITRMRGLPRPELNARTTRMPTSPQPMINRRSRLKRAGRAPKGLWFEGKIGAAFKKCSNWTVRRIHKKMSSSENPTHQVTVQPSGRSFNAQAGEAMLAAAIRQGIGLPYGCKDGACGSCKCKKLSGTVVHGTHQAKALSEEEEANGFVLTCCGVAHSDVVLESRQVTEAGAFAIKKMPSRVSTLEKVSPDVMRIQLQLPANDAFAFHAGQYVEFLLRDGARRSYSMANAPHTLTAATNASPPVGPLVELHIRHMPGGKFTDHVFGAMKEKEILRIEGPYGSFFLREDSDKPMVLLASGTGFAPIKALIEHMQHKQISRPATLYWGGRRPADLYMNDWVLQKQAEMPSLKYVPVVSDATAEDHWSGRTGFVHKAVLQDLSDLSAYQVYACGAPIVVESARTEFSALAGLPINEFFADSFTSEADKAQA